MDWAKLSANALATADLAPRLRLKEPDEAMADLAPRRRLDEQVEAMAGFVVGFANLPAVA